jgi:nitrite reductase/ring-hydroxylating ferredoxin subunit
MAEGERLICASAEVAEGGAGFRFVVQRFGREEPAFAIRFHGRVYAYMNRCGHVPVELDWLHGEFFDHSKLYLICATHGALYAPESGQCLGGRCNGKGLEPVPVEERDGNVYMTPIE